MVNFNRFLLQVIIYSASYLLFSTYSQWVILYRDKNLLGLAAPVLLTTFVTAGAAIFLRTRYPSSWAKHPLLVNAGVVTGFAIGVFIVSITLF